MRKKKWLFVVVAILLLLNIIFYALVRWVKLDQQVKTRIVRIMEENLNAHVSIEDFDFNDKQLNVSGLEIIDKNEAYRVFIPQIYIEYNLAALIFSNFKNLRNIKSIKFYQPDINLIIDQSNKEAEKAGEPKSGKLPELKSFFQLANIYDGNIEIAYQNKLGSTKVSWDSVDVSVINDDILTVDLTGYKDNELTITGNGSLKSMKLEKLDIDLRNLKADYFSIANLDELDFLFNGSFHKLGNDFDFAGSLTKLLVKNAKYEVIGDSLGFYGNDDFIDIDLNDINLDENLLTGHFIVEKYLEATPIINSEISIDNILLNRYVKGVNGDVDLQLFLTGNLADPKISLSAESEVVSYQKEQIEAIEIEGNLNKNLELNFNINNFFWNDNLIIGSGMFDSTEGLLLNLNSNNFDTMYNDITVRGDLDLDLIFKDALEIKGEINGLSLQYKHIILDQLSVNGTLDKEQYSLELMRKYDDLSLNIDGSLGKPNNLINIRFSQFALDNFLGNSKLPVISGGILIDHKGSDLLLNSQMRVFDKDYGRFSGTLKTSGFYNVETGKKSLVLKTQKARYNYEDFDLEVAISGVGNNVAIDQMQLNDELFVDGDLSYSDSLIYDIEVIAKNLKIRDYLKYFFNYQFYSQFDGSFDLDFSLDSTEDSVIKGDLNFNNILYRGLKSMDLANHFDGDFKQINFTSLLANKDEDCLVKLEGDVDLRKDTKLHVMGNSSNLELEKIFADYEIMGNLQANLNFLWQKENPTFNLSVEGSNLAYKGFSFDSLAIDLKQHKDRLVVDQLDLCKKDQFNFTGSGALGYNLINSKSTGDISELDLIFNGDLLSLFASSTSIVEDAASNAHLQMNITAEEGLKIDSADFSLRKGYIKFIDQQETLRNIKIDFTMDNDSLNLSKFSGKFGDGIINIANVIEGDEREFSLGGINLGKFLISTGDTPILFHMPLYMPGNSVSSTTITGRDSDYCYLYGPFDNIRIVGDIYFSNGKAIYPSRSENLLNIIRTITTQKREGSTSIPLSLDLMLHFTDNIKYVTYPLNLLVNDDSYLQLIYDQEKFSVPDANFKSESGIIDIFGSQMEAEFVEVNINKFASKVKIYGRFIKKVSDGTTITLEVSNSQLSDVSGNVNDLAFNLTSDNSGDSQLDILALLRYDRRTNDISQSQQKTLLQDEVLQLAGIGIEGVLIDPLISPLENWVRQILNLDFFYLQTDMIQNLFNRYSSDQTEYFLDEEGQKSGQNTSEIFLNNLSIGMGKYLSRKLFINYELQFEKLQDLSIKSDIGVYHNITLRYDLPRNFNLAYKYSILPFGEPSNHEVRLEKTWRF